ncbi:hypothetical protein JMM81_02465 [Bacillus sp. V3B]|uniref:hypothetical protein n=1 Tax=Bacillus sp. V3B TaxID=2804915 RepID=UPI00210AFCAF|nr:hypothetical protein [Bacillus sp. V3B]MCQ6273840.1 hypothetical protein [Bacillus sp. V3B]
MRDYLKRLLIVGIMAFCISLLFFGIKQTQAEVSVSESNLNKQIFKVPLFWFN